MSLWTEMFIDNLDECKYKFFYWSKLLKTETVYEILKYPGITENTLHVYI